MDSLFASENLVALLTLTLLEVVLGIDNVIFISILAGKLPEQERKKARLIGLSLALGARILLLLSLSWVMRLTTDLFTLLGMGISGKDLVLIIGGLFLVAKATHEIHSKIEVDEHAPEVRRAGFTSIVIQILLIDIVFSLDSVITAVGMVSEISIMITAVIVSIGIMMAFAGTIGAFVERHPAIKMLALSFLILIGVMLVAQGFDQKIDKGYIYFAMAFSLGVELLNMRFRKKTSVKSSNPGH
ncbi:MAG: TerC family protein [Myxococcales bacterium]|nr:MAG: TerC family protein [Myxococcales bacterium]